MASVLKKQLEQLLSTGNHTYLKGVLHGIEKEGLRVDRTGELSQSDHPIGLGSALTNGTITTDYSESLLEFITPVFEKPEDALSHLENLHRFSYQHLDEELIWGGSMPCHIKNEAAVPIAHFGTSNVGQLKHIYRVGLEHRYGKMMQTIAGIHYNFSLPDDFWRALQTLQKNTDSLQSFRSASYFRLIRNFRRNSWLLLYLFGASPALCDSFLKGKKHQLETLHEHTLYLPYATSLRMSDLGYSNKAQASLSICFNHLNTYISSLHRAIHTSYAAYEAIGTKVDGQYKQLNTSILQIENEYYSDIRPKRVAQPGEKPLHALHQRGVEYIEVRNTDINPFLPIGMDIQQAKFLDAFLISCLLMSDDEIGITECDMISDNLEKVVTRGREPGLTLETLDGPVSLIEAGNNILAQVQMTAVMLDTLHQGADYQNAVTAQHSKLDDVSLTPSAQVLSALKESGLNHTEWLLQKSAEHKQTFNQSTLPEDIQKDFTQQAQASLAEQNAIEASDTLDFDQYLAAYLAS
ncbi:glutamate--cysteine ligase [Neptunomonas antarctica]|uniref:Glutamate--cysteine ligase n=1 Tax=Neptunomonas antarctica TaxID=619304 RepID=A0A1N7MM03_9GAMM|nr:glutamate--cysteine ligase [Neptunomonas antarctica]SIS86961.1 glutamate-cysteine ligase [Neptunomonas antarctica]